MKAMECCLMFKKIFQKTFLWLLDKTGYQMENQINKQEEQKPEPKNFSRISVKNIKFLNKKTPKIPRHIFFVCLGEEESYMRCCINSFREFNSNYKIDILQFTRSEFLRDKITKKIIKQDNIDLKLLDDDVILYKLANKYNFTLIYTYGGIYSSLKNFCIRPLDEILNHECFISMANKNFNICPSTALFGVCPNFVKNIDFHLFPPIDYNDRDYQSMKMAFYNCCLKTSLFKPVNNHLQTFIYNFDV